MMTIAIERVHPRFGARITGVDLARPLDDVTFKALFEAFYDYSVPPVEQVMIRTNPVNRRTSIYVASHASHIVGLAVEEGRALIRELIDLTTRPDNVYRHVWSAGDLVMWDNRCMLHRGRPWDGTKYRRVMHRTTVAGVGPTVPDELRAPTAGR